jgi:competence protein ComEA
MSKLSAYTRSERNGFILLTFAAIVLMSIPAIKGHWQTAKTTVKPAAVTDEATSTTDPIAFSDFDPNNDSEAALVAAGWPAKAAGQLVKYRSKGAKFRQVEDLKKLYCMTDALYEQLAPFAHIEADAIAYQNHKQYNNRPQYKNDVRNDYQDRPTYPKYENQAPNYPKNDVPTSYAQSAAYQSSYKPNQYSSDVPRVRATVKSMDINTASQADLEAIPGIGPYFAGKVMRFRNALGGFSSISQVAETQQLADSVFQKMAPYLFYKTSATPIDLLADVETLNRHPYISQRQATAIVNYRTQHAGMVSAQNLETMKIFSTDEWSRLEPYLAQDGTVSMANVKQ